MTIINVDSVACLNDVAIRYINHLLEKHAMDQHMLANQKPADERVLERLTEIRAKNTELEFKNRELRSQNEGLNRAIDTLKDSQELIAFKSELDTLKDNQELIALKSELDTLKDSADGEIEALREQFNAAATSLVDRFKNEMSALKAQNNDDIKVAKELFVERYTALCAQISPHIKKAS